MVAVMGAIGVISPEARRLHEVYRAAGAYSALNALPDHEAAARANVPQRDVIDRVVELLAEDVAILAGELGRYIESDPSAIREYAEKLHDRAKAIHGRARRYDDCADRLEARQGVNADGQRRLFAQDGPRTAWAQR